MGRNDPYYFVKETIGNIPYLTCTVDVDGLYCSAGKYEGWNFNSGNYLFTNDTK